MELRRSPLDAALHALSRAKAEAMLTMSDDTDLAPEMAPGDAAAENAGIAPERRAAVRTPADKVSIKLLCGSGGMTTPEGEETGVETVTASVETIGGAIVSTGERVLIADIPSDALPRLAGIKGLLRAEEPRRLRPTMQDARGPATGLDQALAIHTDLDGSGVVFGIIDSGVDWRHPDFINEDGTTRLELFIHAHRPLDTDVYEVFDRAAINNALQGGGGVPDGDPGGHGTHCAGIAAGNGRGDARFRGVAPGATIMAVRSTFHDTQIIEGIRRIFAAAGDRPSVVNLSLGGHVGAHDGTSAIENVIAQESGRGRIVVVAAGNENGDRIAFHGRIEPDDPLDIPFTIRDVRQDIDVWLPRGDDIGISMIDGAGNVFEPEAGSLQQTPSGDFYVADLRQDLLNRDVNFNVRVIGDEGDDWAIRLAPLAVTQGTVHAWATTLDPDKTNGIFPAIDPPLFSLGMPGTEERAITVASFITRSGIGPDAVDEPGIVAGGISSFSSVGPARLGAQRPDIAAPGQHVTAALADGSDFETRFADRLIEGDQGGRYLSIQGTSMATPFVAGVIALMLQREPELYPEEIQQRLRATARRDGDTGNVWNPTWGFGKIDTEALLNYLVAV